MTSLVSDTCFFYNIITDQWTRYPYGACKCENFQGFCMQLGSAFLSFGGEGYGLGPISAGFAYFQSKLYFFGGAACDIHGSFNFYDTFEVFGFTDVIETFQDQNSSIICSPGTYLNNSECLLCPAGTYKEGYNNDTSCVLCGPGKFNPNIGSNSKKQCYPCYTGTYTKDSGAFLCLDCLYDYACNTGTYILKRNIKNPTNTNIQPLAYSPKDYSLLIFEFQMIFGFVMLALMTIGILCFSKKLKRFDLFINSHCYQLNAPIVLIKTTFGSIFSVIFIVLCFILIVVTILSYELQNTSEIKMLQPLPVLRNEVDYFSADIQIISELENYGDICELNSECSSDIIVTAYNFDMIDQYYTCHQVGSSCFVNFLCTNCAIGAQAYVKFAFQSTYSYASAINVNVTSTSSIPESNSSVTSSIEPQYNQIYAGPIDSSFNFLITPSLFISYVSEFKSNVTGYHITEKLAPSPGSMVYINELANSFRLGISVYLSQSDSGLYTERYQPQTFTLFISSILGSIAGLMGAITFIMRFIEERVSESMETKEQPKIKLSDIKSNRNILTINWKSNIHRPCAKKIQPIIAFVNEKEPSLSFSGEDNYKLTHSINQEYA